MTYKVINFYSAKPCFDYRIRIEKKKFKERYNKHQSEILHDSLKNISDKIKNMGGVFETLTVDDITALFDKDNSDSIKKLDELKNQHPEQYFEFMGILTKIISKVYSAMELFVMDRENLKDLFEIMLEGNISVIKLNPDSEEKQKELDETGILMLNDFFLSRNHSVN